MKTFFWVANSGGNHRLGTLEASVIPPLEVAFTLVLDNYSNGCNPEKLSVWIYADNQLL